MYDSGQEKTEQGKRVVTGVLKYEHDLHGHRRRNGISGRKTQMNRGLGEHRK